MTIRDACVTDLATIQGIWNHYIQNTTANWRYDGYTQQEMQQWFSQHGAPDRPVLVVEEQGRISGFGALSTFRASPGYKRTAEDTIYLVPDALGRGMGMQLMNALLERGKAGGLSQVISMIDSSNVSSIRFHTKLGFDTIGTLKDVGEKFGKTLSCVVMQKQL